MGTEFFTAIHEVPLATDDPRRRRDKMLLSSGELVCWRCGRNFGHQTKWVELAEHVDGEWRFGRSFSFVCQ